ncbi:MAG: peptidyl-prolyl cis-trans isomerase [Bacillaceae bacterium]|nr:peptidyl-prolyl cis-trans isomerase [Bacillaceae bacterium]
MAEVITITGNVKFPITLDPSVWIFDDRKLKMPDALENRNETQPDLPQAPPSSVPLQWERELQDRNIPSLKSEKLFVEKKDISGDYGMKLGPFLGNAQPSEEAKEVICHLQQGEPVSIPLEQAKDAILLFALDGQPIRGEEGPVHLFLADGTNRDNPIKGIYKFEVL